MTRGSSHDYAFGQKAHWRRWLWNRIRERLFVPTSQAQVYYLAGADDLDRDEAVRRGFGVDNLIAVERDKRAVRQLRRRGVLCVHGEFFRTLAAIPEARAADVIVGDFCCGYSRRIAGHVANEATPRRSGFVCAYNFMRGRETDGRDIRELYANLCQVLPDILPTDAKHRGGVLASEIIWPCFLSALRQQSDMTMTTTGMVARDWISSLPEDRQLHVCRRVGEEILKQMKDWFRFDFSSYLSTSGQVFDTVVFRVPPHANAVPRGRVSDYRVSAILAHQTLRRTGWRAAL